MLPKTFTASRPTSTTTEETLITGLFWASLSFSTSTAAGCMAPDSGNTKGRSAPLLFGNFVIAECRVHNKAQQYQNYVMRQTSETSQKFHKVRESPRLTHRKTKIQLSLYTPLGIWRNGGIVPQSLNLSTRRG
jgi:hypothetical protein